MSNKVRFVDNLKVGAYKILSDEAVLPSGSNAILNNLYADNITSPNISGSFTGSYTGSFSGDGSQLTNLSGSIIPGAFPINYIVKYLDTDISLTGTQIVNTDTVYITGSFLQPPTGFPSISKTNFNYYLNGILISPKNVTSFTQQVGYCELVLDTGSIGISLQNGDEIEVIGKFDTNAFSSGFSSGFSSFSYNLVSSPTLLKFT
jgi:hypothetical protein